MSATVIGAVVVSHGRLADELLAAARMIVGEMDNVRAVSVEWDKDPDNARERIRLAIAELDRGAGVLVLTDMFGGTPTNLALTFLEKERVEVLTGVNLPMLIKLASIKPGETLPAVAQKLRAQGQKSIYLASEVLAGMAE